MTARPRDLLVTVDNPYPADPRFPLGARVRIVALPEGITDCRHLIGYSGTVCRVGATEGPRNLTVCFDWEDGKPDSGGFWTFAAEHLEIVEPESVPAAHQQEGLL